MADPTARDIMFTNPFFSKFFDLGQVINTERGGGVFQPAVDQAVKLLQDGEWVRGLVGPVECTRCMLMSDSHLSGGQGQPAVFSPRGRSDTLQMGHVSPAH